MAFAIGAHVPSFGEWLTPSTVQISERAGIFPAINARSNSSQANDTINMFLDSTNPRFRYAASIVTACVDQTVFAIQCTSGAGVGSLTCGPNAAIATLTSGASIYAFSSAISTSTLGVPVTVTAQETCNLGGTTAATCTATVKGTVSTSTTSTTTTETLSGTDYYRFDVSITGGAEKTANPTGTCGPKKSAASSVHSKNVMLWGLACVTGAAMVFSSI